MLECVRYKSINKNSCLGIATIKIPKLEIELDGFTLHQKDGKRWVKFPSREYESNGEKKWVSTVWIKDAELRNRFLIAVKLAIEEHAQQGIRNKAVEEQSFSEDIPF